MLAPLETRESLEQKQRNLNRRYKALIKHSEANLALHHIEVRLSRLRREINIVDSALKRFNDSAFKRDLPPESDR